MSVTGSAHVLAALSVSQTFLVRAATHELGWLQDMALTDQAADLIDGVCQLKEEIARHRDDVIQVLFVRVGLESSVEKRRGCLSLKRLVQKSTAPLQEDTWAELFSPDDPIIDSLKDLNQKLNELSQIRERWRADFYAKMPDIRARLAAILRRPLVREGVYLSSRDLYDGLVRYLNRERTGTGPPKQQRKFERNVTAHITRACTSTVPRSVLTAVSVVDPGLNSSSAPSKDLIHKRRTYLCWPYTDALARHLSLQGERWRFVVPRVNPTWSELTEDGQPKIQFWRWDTEEETYTLCRIPGGPIVRSLITLMEKRQLHAGQLLDKVAGDARQEVWKIEEYYHDLCRAGLFIGWLEIPVWEFERLDHVMNWLGQLPHEHRSNDTLTLLESIRDQLADLDDPRWQFDEKKALAYESVCRLAKRLLPDYEPATPDKLLVVDSLASPDLFSQHAAAEVLREEAREVIAFDHLLRIRDSVDIWKSYRRALIESLSSAFGSRRGVAIADLFDLSNLEAPRLGDFSIKAGVRADLTAFQDPSGARLRIPPDLAMQLDSDRPVMPGGDGSYQFFHCRSESPANRNDSAQLVGVGYWPKVTAHARMAHLFDGLTQEGNPLDRAIRSIVGSHLASSPYLETGVPLRSTYTIDSAGWQRRYYPYHIELNPAVYTGTEVETLLPLHTLELKWDEERESVELYSRSLGRPLCVHLPGTLFLGGDDWFSNLLWPLENVQNPCWTVFGRNVVGEHSPRVEMGQHILSAERWLVHQDELPDLDRLDDADAVLEINIWRMTKDMPRRVTLEKEHDEESTCLLDFLNPFHLSYFRTFLRNLGKGKRLVFSEFLPDLDRVPPLRAGSQERYLYSYVAFYSLAGSQRSTKPNVTGALMSAPAAPA